MMVFASGAGRFGWPSPTRYFARTLAPRHAADANVMMRVNMVVSGS
jgi:hypothetical protein